MSCSNRVSARHDYCSACNRMYTELFGADWHQLEWARYAIQHHREQACLDEINYKIIDRDTRFSRPMIVDIATVGIALPDIAAGLDGKRADDMDGNYYTIPDKRKIVDFDMFIAQQCRKYGLG